MPGQRRASGGGGLETITITLNGSEVSGAPGMTVLDLARESGVHIPTLCHDPHLDPVGACRICLVEDERSGGLLASCVTPISPGMVINTGSPKVMERRKTIVKLMLASHPDSCMVCDKGNMCELRKIAADMGIGLTGLDRIPQPGSIQEANPYIERDLSRCILCAKCIRADQELVVEGAIDYLDRGFPARPATFGDRPLEQSECTFCGVCVAVCPTGALTESIKPYRGAVSSSVETVCPFCGCGCSLVLDVSADTLVRSRPNPRHSPNGLALCVRGSYGFDFVHHPDRLATPLVRGEGGLEPASWETALDRVATGLLAVRGGHGPGSMGLLGSSKCTNEENYLLQKLARAALGTNNIDNGSRLYGAPGILPLTGSLAPGQPGAAVHDIEASDALLVVGADPTVSAPLVGYAVKRAVRRHNARLIVVDPRRTRLTPFAHVWMRPRPGSEVTLLNGLAHGLLASGVSMTWSPDQEAFQQGTAGYSPAAVARDTGVAEQDIRTAVSLLVLASRPLLLFGNGVAQQAWAMDGVLGLRNLALLLNGRDNGDCALYGLLRENNARGACDMGTLPDFLPGYQGIQERPARACFEESWGCRLPDAPGLSAVEMVQQAQKGQVKAMYVMGENPAASFPDSSAVRNALGMLDFLVVQDMFLTETARLAHVVLPASSFAEKDGTFTAFDGTVQRIHRAISPRGQSLPDWQILVSVGPRLGCQMHCESPEEVMQEISQLVPLYRDISYARLERGGHSVGARAWDSDRRPTTVRYDLPQSTTAEYPFTLLPGSTLYQFGCGTRSSRSRRLAGMAAPCRLDINEADAERLRLKDGDSVRVVSPAHEVRAVVAVSDNVPPGTVFMPTSSLDGGANPLLGISLDPRTRSPVMKGCPVRVERTGGDA